MRRSTLGRGLDSLIHVVEDKPIEEEGLNNKPSASQTAPLWLVEYPSALTPTSLRLSARSRLEKLSTRPRHGLKAARAYLEKLRSQEGRTHTSLDLSGVDLTHCTMIQLQKGRVVDSTRHSFLGLVSIWK